jgi:L,D-peptidoglycan transpeptidase YkuD (ErfK/YbiS/YcfS/YnhG family)
MAADPDKSRDERNKIAKLEVVTGSSDILHFAGRHLPAAIGRSGVRADKREDDGGTPTGFLPLRRMFYRPDRLDLPCTCLPCQPLTEKDGWCDDATHPDYNRQIQLPHSARHENLLLNDGTYAIIGILGYNDDPIISGQGSAIFLHIKTPDMKPTEGCIALSLRDLCGYLNKDLKLFSYRINFGTFSLFRTIPISLTLRIQKPAFYSLIKYLLADDS